MDRRDFLKTAGLGAGALAAAGPLALPAPVRAEAAGILTSARDRDVVVVGAGAFGGWTALRLVEAGARVTLVDMYGPGNSRSTSGDETRGARTSYPNRDLWCSWANRAIGRWNAFDEEWSPRLGIPLFYESGDLILRADWDEFLEDTRSTFEGNGVRYEVLGRDEVAYRWPQIGLDGIGVALYEPAAGVVRARAACQRVADVFRRKGGELRIARASPGRSAGGRLGDLDLDRGGRLAADRFVFALGPWFPKAFPAFMEQRIRISLGHVYYFGTPPGDARFTHPNLPSWNLPGVTGWPTLPPDDRGFRVRTGGRAANDPDTSVRWIPEAYHEQPRRLLERYFPGLVGQPLVETRACHYESSVTRNWIIDRHPELENVWVAGGGSAEGFKFGPVLGDLIAGRVLDRDRHPELADEFRIREEDLRAPPLPWGTGAGRG